MLLLAHKGNGNMNSPFPTVAERLNYSKIHVDPILLVLFYLRLLLGVL